MSPPLSDPFYPCGSSSAVGRQYIRWCSGGGEVPTAAAAKCIGIIGPDDLWRGQGWGSALHDWPSCCLPTGPCPCVQHFGYCPCAHVLLATQQPPAAFMQMTVTTGIAPSPYEGGLRGIIPREGKDDEEEDGGEEVRRSSHAAACGYGAHKWLTRPSLLGR